MIKKIKIFLATLVMPLAIGAPLAMPSIASAQTTDTTISDGLCGGSNFSVSGGTCDKTASETKLNTTLKLVIDIFSLVVGVISVIMIIVGGLKYITSAGDSGNVTSAKNTILYAVIGLVVVALAQFIVRYVLSKVSG